MTTNTELITVDRDDIYAVAQTDKVTPFIPAGFHSVIKFAQLINASGMAPKDMNTPDKIAVAIFHGMEVGMTPMASLQSIAVINGRPSIWGDGALAMIRASGQLEDIEEFYEGEWLLEDGKTVNPAFKAVCVVKRKDAKRSVRNEFSVADAQRAQLWSKANTPWITYPKRMLKMRARSWAIRDEFTDIMRGLVLAEEAQDFDDMKDVTSREAPPASPPAAEKRTRKPKDTPANKYQEAGDGKANVEEAEVISETKASGAAQTTTVEEDDERPPAATGKAVVAKPAAKKAEPKEEKPDDAQEGQIMLDDLLSRVGPDKELKEHLKYLHGILAVPSTQDDAKTVWMNRTQMKGVTTGQRIFVDELRNWHKDRIAKIESEKPPVHTTSDPEADKSEAPEFDYAAFKAHVTAELDKLTTAEDVNKVFLELTDGPVSDRLLTEDQYEGELKQLLEAALERTDAY